MRSFHEAKFCIFLKYLKLRLMHFPTSDRHRKLYYYANTCPRIPPSKAKIMQMSGSDVGSTSSSLINYAIPHIFRYLSPDFTP